MNTIQHLGFGFLQIDIFGHQFVTDKHLQCHKTVKLYLAGFYFCIHFQ